MKYYNNAHTVVELVFAFKHEQSDEGKLKIITEFKDFVTKSLYTDDEKFKLLKILSEIYITRGADNKLFAEIYQITFLNSNFLD